MDRQALSLRNKGNSRECTREAMTWYNDAMDGDLSTPLPLNPSTPRPLDPSTPLLLYSHLWWAGWILTCQAGTALQERGGSSTTSPSLCSHADHLCFQISALVFSAPLWNYRELCFPVLLSGKHWKVGIPGGGGGSLNVAAAVLRAWRFILQQVGSGWECCPPPTASQLGGRLPRLRSLCVRSPGLTS